MKQDKLKSLTPPLWKLILLCSIASFCTLLPADAIVPLSQHFHISTHQSASVIAWFLLGYGVGPLLYAPLANRYGRKKALFIGLSIALVGMMISLLSLSLHNFFLMLSGRFISGIGSSAGLVIGMIIINETTTPSQARRLFSLVTLFFAIMPSIAMACGGFLSQHVGLFSLFALMPALTIVVMLVVSSMQETYRKPPVPIQLMPITRGYINLLKNKTFILLTAIMAAASATTYVFNAISPLIAIDHLKISATTYGNLAIIPALGLVIGATMSTAFSKRYSAAKSKNIGLSLMLAGSLIMVFCFQNYGVHLGTMLTPAILIFSGTAIVIPNASMSAIGSASDPAAGSALVSSASLIMSSLTVSLTDHYFNLGDMLLPIVLTTLALLGICLLKLSQRSLNKNNSRHTKIPTNAIHLKKQPTLKGAYNA